MKNSLDRLMSRLDVAEEIISELEDTSIETPKTEKHTRSPLRPQWDKP